MRYLKAALAAATLAVLALTPAAATTARPAPAAVVLAQASAPGWDVLILGSSTTACSGPSNVDACYVSRLQQARPQHRYTVIGQAGTLVSQWATSPPIPEGQELVVIQLGINDWYVPVQPGQYRTDVNTLTARVRAANPAAVIVWLRAWMPNYTSPARLDMWALHGMVTQQAMAAVGGVFVDVPGDPAPYRITAEGWHYNDSGHQRLVFELLRFL